MMCSVKYLCVCVCVCVCVCWCVGVFVCVCLDVFNVTLRKSLIAFTRLAVPSHVMHSIRKPSEYEGKTSTRAAKGGTAK
jgi:hypothetical protein